MNSELDPKGVEWSRNHFLSMREGGTWAGSAGPYGSLPMGSDHSRR
jgi:hypothetical protein